MILNCFFFAAALGIGGAPKAAPAAGGRFTGRRRGGRSESEAPQSPALVPRAGGAGDKGDARN